MKLKSVQVENFKCIEDSTEFEVGPVTCLVGKNESGKTAILEALYKLNPAVREQDKFNALLEYPRRRLKDYQDRAAEKPDDAVITNWELEERDIAQLEQTLGSGAVKSRTVALNKGYYNGPRWSVELDDAKIAQHLLSSASLDNADKDRYKDQPSLEALISSLGKWCHGAANRQGDGV